MNDQNDKNVRKLENPAKTGSNASGGASASGWKKLFTRRWVFPALYMAAAALIVTILWLYPGTEKETENPAQASPGVESESAAGTTGTTGATGEETEAAPVAGNGETLQWPVKNRDEMVIAVPYYDPSAPEEERAAAIVEQDNTFTPHMAVDLARSDQQPFEVLAALSGTVKVARQDPVDGYVAEIEHPNGLVTVYKSLSELRVQEGEEVEQGDVIAIAGTSGETGDEGARLHFEIRHNGQLVNPTTLIRDE
jgi:stage II sporulation protein Q